MKEQILSLRKEGKTYREIQKIVNCSRSLISYYVNPEGKTKNRQRKNLNRFRLRAKYKLQSGGKCQTCGYDKCLDALQFHHKIPSDKKFNIGDAIWGIKKISKSDIQLEISKCILLCANCHFELHSIEYSQHS
jgi:5-methylcytosine-specific restriction endonuclease McrA